MHRPSIIFAVALVVTIAGVSSEYIWTGTEWKWKDIESPGASSDSSGTETGILDSTSEGSGDGDTWDDEDSYDNYDDYDEEIEGSTKNNNKYDFEDYCAPGYERTRSLCCPRGWREFGGHCYFLLADNKVAEDCRTHCFRFDAELASIESQEENNFLAGYIAERHPREKKIGKV